MRRSLPGRAGVRGTPGSTAPARASRHAARRLASVAAVCLALACEGSPGSDPAQTRGPDGDPSAVDAAPAAGSTEAAASEGTRVEQVAGLRFEVPEAWVAEPPQSQMRVAQYRLPGPGGAAELVLFRFPGGGGSADANVARWIGQLTQPDGSSSTDRAKVQTAEQDGLTLTRLDLRGQFEGQQMPGAPAQPPIEEARLLALIVEGSGDPYYFKVVGAAATLDPWSDAWNAFTESIAAE